MANIEMKIPTEPYRENRMDDGKSVCDECEKADYWECYFCCEKCYEDYGECPFPDECDPWDI